MQLLVHKSTYHTDTYRAKGDDECCSVHGMEIALAVWYSVYGFSYTYAVWLVSWSHHPKCSTLEYLLGRGMGKMRAWERRLKKLGRENKKKNGSVCLYARVYIQCVLAM